MGLSRPIALALAAFGLTLLGAVAVLSPPRNSASTGILGTAPNVVRLAVRAPRLGFNRLLVSVTICVPHASECLTVDDVLVDTGSTGLRLEASAIPSSFHLPPMTGPDGGQIGECVRFVHANAWGTLFKADLHLGGMIAFDLPIQIYDAGRAQQPVNCPNPNPPVQPTSNGTLGLGPWPVDCGGLCRQDPVYPGYFTCATDGCRPIPDHVELSLRMVNPVSRFGAHSNGVVFDIPAAPPGGTRALDGTLTFGVGTSDNNQLGQARIVPLDGRGWFTTNYAGRVYPSYIDSGTQTYVFTDDQLPRCKVQFWEFCVAPERRLQATIVGRDGTQVVIPFMVGHYEDIRAHGFGASASIAVAPSYPTDPFVWGAPFFMGKRVFVVIDGKAVPGAGMAGPFYAVE